MSETTTPIMYRHGDVLLRRLGDVPPPTQAEPAEVVVAEGEATGHAHRVRGAGVALHDRSEDTGRIELDVPAGGTISHEEHRMLVLVPGRYEVRHQRTMTQPGIWERVRD